MRLICLILIGVSMVSHWNALAVTPSRAMIHVGDSEGDAEEFQNDDKEMSIGSNRLFMGSNNNGVDQIVGIQFDNIPLAPNSVIHNAYIQFSAAEESVLPTSVAVKVENNGLPVPFDYDAGNISKREFIETSVNWDIAPWLIAGRRGPLQATPNLKPILESLIRSEGWQSGQSALFTFEGTGKRAASSFDDIHWPSPTLIIDFSTPPSPSDRISKLFINEISSGWNTVPDQDGDYVDWIEIYNPNDFDISGDHLFLSDRVDKPDKWELSPQLIIPAQGHLVIFADGENEKGIDHASFSVSAKGESLVLSQETPFGFIQLDLVTTPNLKGIPSYGRSFDGDINWLKMGNPTPAASNVPENIFTEQPVIYPDTGKFSDPVIVEIAAPYENSTIYYTTDGAYPTLGSNVYSSPFMVSESSTIRAIAVTESRADSPVISKTYLINEETHLPIITLSVDPDHLFSDENGIYVKGTNGLVKNCDFEPANWNQPWQKPVQLSWIEPNGSVAFEINAGIEIAGQCTRRFRQKTLEVKTKSRWGSSDIPYSIFENRTDNSYRRFKLRGSGNDWAGTLFRDGFTHEWIARQGIDLELQSYRPVEVFINGMYWGLHNVRDVHNKHSIFAKYPGVEKDLLDVVKKYDIRSDNVERRIQTGNADAYKELQFFLQNNSMTDEANWSKLKDLVDIESAIDYHIVEIFVGNHDWPDSNVGLWRENKPFEKWRYLLFDLDDGFGRSDTGKTEPSYNSLRDALDGESDIYPHSKVSTLMFRRLMEAPEFRNEFIQRMATRMELNFAPDLVGPEIDRFAAVIEPTIERHIQFWNSDVESVLHQKYGHLYPSPDLGIEDTIDSIFGWRDEVQAFKDYWGERIPEVRRHIMETLNVEGTFNLTINNTGLEQGRVTINRNIMDIPEIYTGTHFQGIPMRVQAHPSRGYKFDRWFETGETNPVLDLVTSTDLILTPIFVEDDVDLSKYEGLIISEINYNPGKTGYLAQEELEFIEFTNLSNSTMDISGVKVGAAFETYSFPDATILSPGGSIILSRNPVAFREYRGHKPHIRVVGPWSDGKLSNKGESILVSARNMERIFFLTYSDKNGWPIDADGEGSTLQFKLYSTLKNNPQQTSAILSDPNNWKASDNLFGSPGIVEFHPLIDAITVDGDISEWVSNNQIGSDPIDVLDPSQPIDLELAAFSSRNNNYYFGFVNAGNVELNYGWSFFLNSGSNKTTYSIEGFQTDYLVQNENLFEYVGEGFDWNWRLVDIVDIHASQNTVELSIPHTLLPGTGEWQFLFAGDNAAYGGNIIDYAPDLDSTPGYWTMEFSPVVPHHFTPNPDGDLNEWPGSTQIFESSDPSALLRGGLLRSLMAHDQVNLFFGLGFKESFEPASGLSIWLDTDMNLATGYSVGGIGADVLIQDYGIFRFIEESDRTNGERWEFAGNVQIFEQLGNMELILPWKFVGKIDAFTFLITTLDENNSHNPAFEEPLNYQISFSGSDERPTKIGRSDIGSNHTITRIPNDEGADIFTKTLNENNYTLTDNLELIIETPSTGRFAVEYSYDLNFWIPEHQATGFRGINQVYLLKNGSYDHMFIRVIEK